MNNRKENLIGELLGGKISAEAFDELTGMTDRADYRRIIMRIFDLNEGGILNNSTADSGILGFFNRRANHRKIRKLARRLKRTGRGEGKKMILVEGDSWFEHPFIMEIVDWLFKDKNNLIHSLAYAGDWIANIIYEEQYITELMLYQPEIFLISGGGNDLVGDGRLGMLVNKPSLVDFGETPEDVRLTERIIAQDFDNGEIDSRKRAEMIVRGTKYLTDNFFALLKVFELMYRLFFTGIEKAGKFDDMKIITQGYDFAVPSNSKNPFDHPVKLLGNGHHLYSPLAKKGITNAGEQESIISAAIYNLNEMLIRTGQYCNAARGSNYVFHIDSRGALRRSEWADELHPRSKAFKRISSVYAACIAGEQPLDSDSPAVYPVRKYGVKRE
jgi:hypothetical protein